VVIPSTDRVPPPAPIDDRSPASSGSPSRHCTRHIGDRESTLVIQIPGRVLRRVGGNCRRTAACGGLARGEADVRACCVPGAPSVFEPYRSLRSHSCIVRSTVRYFHRSCGTCIARGDVVFSWPSLQNVCPTIRLGSESSPVIRVTIFPTGRDYG
jgi:hypothetical protein